MSVIYRALRNLEQREANVKRGMLHAALLRLENGTRSLQEQRQPNLFSPDTTANTIMARELLGISDKGRLLKEQLQRQFKKWTITLPSSHSTEGQRFSSILGQLADRVRRPQVDGIRPKQSKRNSFLIPVLLITPLLAIVGGRIWFLYPEIEMDSMYNINLEEVFKPVSQGVLPLIAHFFPEQETMADSFTPEKPRVTPRPTLAIEHKQTAVVTQPRLVLEKPPSPVVLPSEARPPVVLPPVQPPQEAMPSPANPVSVSATPLPMEQEKPLALAKTQADSQPQEAVETSLSKSRKERDEIAQMVTHLGQAIAQGDTIKVGELLDALSLVKQANDAYLLNMRAYWYMTQQEYDKAEIYLKQVLMRDSEDLEAGLNLAIIEAHTNRKKDAQQRLHLLSQRYPTESRLHYVLNTLR